MNIAFTICSNNYLAYAKTLGDSFLQYHPDYRFVIGLVDKYAEGVDYSFLSSFDIIPVEALQIENFETLSTKYNITELNTVVKPSYFHYLFSQLKADKAIYIDPDILVTSRFEEVIKLSHSENIIVTPHITVPVDDEYAPTDYHNLKVGIFNLGFIALSDYPAVKIFLEWWHDRVIKYGFANFDLHMFYDQLWANYIPCFYDNYHILKHPGYNMANWNLHERILSEANDGSFCVNQRYPLRFFHFSSYKYDRPDEICSYFTRYSFKQRPDLKRLFDTYRKLLIENNVEEICKLPVYYYPDLYKEANNYNLINGIKWRLKRATQILLKGV